MYNLIKYGRYFLTRYTDPFSEENISSFGDLFNRLDSKMLDNLSACHTYKLLNKENEEVKLKYPHLVDIIESTVATNDIYSKEEIQALATYIQNQHMINNYEKYEMYKVGLAECLQWLILINLL